MEKIAPISSIKVKWSTQMVLLMTLFNFGLHAQFSFHNLGNIKMHQDAQIGFHENLINDGTFDENLGLVGFYNDDRAYISGAFKPVFNDVEIMVANNLFLEVGLAITHNSNFVLGDVVTPRNLTDIQLEYRNQAFYTGATDNRKVDGYTAITDRTDFIFPTGSSQRLRPLQLLSNSMNSAAKAAYFDEKPNSPTTFSGGFDTTKTADIIIAISENEFWDVDSDVPSKVRLIWDDQSNLTAFLDSIENLRVVGWNTADKLWEDLGGTDINGDFNSGSITSNIFVPDQYAIITFGGSLSKESITLDNYFLTPNGDGINDFFHLEAVSISPNNRLQVFNRWGRKVYHEQNYTNRFNGEDNVNSVFAGNNKLPAGIYFYIIDLYDIAIEHQGYLYIEQ